MSRPHRLWLHEGVYHLTIRGNNRQPIFLASDDYDRYLRELWDVRERYPFHLLAYALMTNHVHLVVRTMPDSSMSDAMRQLGGNYSRYFNERHKCVGHLYQGRFYSNLVDRDSYLLEVTRYVHLNPCRAHLAPNPAVYQWSSYKIFTGAAENPLRLVEPETILALFGDSPAEQVIRYRDFVEGLATEEQETWVRRLQRHALIPPRRWLEK
jgi:REP element-mobilizing transposase RayT